MATLSLFRHAKSAWDNPNLDDFDRPLARRGENSAPRMGRHMERAGLVPDLVICSTARRARQTLEGAAGEWTSAPEIRYEDGLYHAGPNEMVGIVRGLPPSCAHAMLVGHNPGLHLLAVQLCGDGESGAMQALGVKFPTAGLAVIDFKDSWENVMQDAGFLRALLAPRELPDA